MLNTKIIGDKIVKARKESNMSQAQLSELLFISPQAIGKWERGESIPDLITFNRLAEILGVDLNYFSESFHSSANEISSDKLSEKQTDELSFEKEDKKPKWDMSLGNWVDADFSGLKNLNEKFGASNMQCCKFVGSDLSHLILKNNNVDLCDFSKSEIRNSRIQSSNLANNTFKSCSLNETEFSKSYVAGCDFTDADFTGVMLKDGGFEKNIIAESIWKRTSFMNTHLADLVFEGKLDDCYFENCKFTRVTFQHSVLSNTFFKNNNLKKVQFIDCQADRITYEFLKSGKADISGITLLTQ